MVTQVLRVTLKGRSVTVPVRRHRGARRYTIYIDAAVGGARLIMPMNGALSEAEAALRQHADWLLERLAALPARVVFADGVVIPFHGEEHRIVHRTDGRGVVERVPGEIHVRGRPEHVGRRVTDWLKLEAHREITPRVLEKAAIVDRRVRHISVRDQRSRWGSCSEQGRLSFNWRLILTPDHVLDYVVAHEVAHLIEMNHSPAFWRLVDRLTADAAVARRWLERNGQSLYRYG